VYKEKYKSVRVINTDMSDEASQPFEIQHCRCQNDTFVVQKFPKGADGQYLYDVICSKCDKHYTQFKDAK